MAVLLALAVGATPAHAAGLFFDDDGSVHERAIEGLAAAGVTEGCDPPLTTRYCPADGLTRGEAAALLRRALDVPASGVDAFVDDEGSVFEGDLDALAAAGVLRGCDPPTDTRACPDRVLTRGEAAALLRRALDVPASDVDAFVDDEGSVFEGDLDALAAARVLRGCDPPTNDRACPGDRLTRAQAASLLVRALDGLEERSPGRLHERTITYEVREFGTSRRASVGTLALRAGEALTAAQGWSIGRRLSFQRVASGGAFTLWLTPAEDVGDRADVCVDSFSCTVGDDVYVNDRNLVSPPETFAERTVAEYQRYLVLHEVGHWLGFDDTADASGNHYNDPRWCVAGEAPVMMQQSITTQGCDENVWPLPFELDCVEEAWLQDTTDQGVECPHTEPAR